MTYRAQATINMHLSPSVRVVAEYVLHDQESRAAAEEALKWHLQDDFGAHTLKHTSLTKLTVVSG